MNISWSSADIGRNASLPSTLCPMLMRPTISVIAGSILVRGGAIRGTCAEPDYSREHVPTDAGERQTHGRWRAMACAGDGAP